MFVTNGTSLCASPSRESTYRAMERAKEAGCRVVFDVDYRAMSWRSPEEAGLAVRLALPFIDILIGNQLELTLVAGVERSRRRDRKLRRAGVPMLVSKLGELGTRVWTGEDSVFLPPYTVDVVSTIGAGDGFRLGLPLCAHSGQASARLPALRQCGGGDRGEPFELLGGHADPRRSGGDDLTRRPGRSIADKANRHVLRPNSSFPKRFSTG